MDGVIVRLAGPFGVTRDGTPASGPGMGSRKGRRLLMLLAVGRGQLVPIDRIVDALWSEHPPQHPEQNVATLVSRLRASLGAEAIIGRRDGYRLAPEVRVDIDEADRLVDQAARRLAAGEAALAATAATRALDLLGSGALLIDEPDADWATTARADAHRMTRDARHTAAAAALLADDPKLAIQVLQAAIAADRFDEAAHRLLMDALRIAGEPAQALAVYEHLRAALAAELGIDPAPQTREVHLAVLREQPSALVAEPTERTHAQAQRPDLVGRKAEIGRLRDLWARAATGEAATVLIVGEAGIGKTALAAEMIADAEATGGLVLAARCYATERSLFLQPFLEALAEPLATMRPDRLRDLAGPQAATLAGLLPEIAEVLGSPPSERASPEVELRRAYDAVAHIMRGLASRRPVLLVLDDLQNAGLSTIELLHYLARHARPARLLVLAPVRAEEGAASIDALTDVAGRLELGPLSAEAVSHLAAAAGRADLADVILRRTRGHTLFVAETLRGLAAGEPGVPDSLQTAVLARVRRAGPATEELLRAGAVLGASVDPAIVAGMLDLAPHIAAQRCEQAASTRLLIVAGRDYEFANDLVREVLYTTTSAPIRLAYHRRAADLLTRRPESVAAHAAAAEDWMRAARAYLLAGEQAAHSYASADAETLLSHALHAAQRCGQLDVLGRAYVARGQVRGMLGTYRPALGDVRAGVTAARQVGDRRLEMVALREMGHDIATALGVPLAEVVADLRRALVIAESLGDRAAETDILGRLAIIATNRLQFSQARALALRAVQVGRASGNDKALACGLDGLKTVHAYLGELEPLSAVITELEPMLRRAGDLFRMQWLVFESAFPSIAAADWSLATSRIADALEFNTRSEYVAGQAWFVAHLGWVERLQGHYEQAEQHGRHAVALAETTAHRWWHSTAVAMLAGTLIEIDGREEATRLLSDVQTAPEGGRPEGYLLRCLAPLAELTRSRTMLTDAEALLAAVEAPSGSAWLLGTDCYLAVARAWLDQDEPARARAVLAPLLAAAQRQSWLPALAAGSLVDGLAAAALGDAVSASRLTGRAATLARRHAMPTIEREARACNAAAMS